MTAKKMLKDSTILKTKILSKGFRITKEISDLVDKNVKEEHRGYGDSNWGIKKTTKIPAEIMLPGEIVVATHIRPNSPLCLRVSSGIIEITENGKKVSDVEFLKRPKIWSKTTRSKINMKRIANFYGRDCLNFNIFSGCEFWRVGLPCKFCSVEPTQVQYSEVLRKKTTKEVGEVAKLAFKIENRIDFVIVTGGSYLNGDKEFEMVVPVLKAIRKTIPSSWRGIIKGNVALMPPQTFEKIDELMSTGIEHPSFNLEVWGRKYFNYVCPGKAKYRGFEQILDAYKYAVEKYGRGVFWTNFVGGLNKLKTLKEGFTYMAKIGVVPGANIFHPDVGSAR